jgi:hypothetical protein
MKNPVVRKSLFEGVELLEAEKVEVVKIQERVTKRNENEFLKS